MYKFLCFVFISSQFCTIVLKYYLYTHSIRINLSLLLYELFIIDVRKSENERLNFPKLTKLLIFGVRPSGSDVYILTFEKCSVLMNGFIH